MFAFVVLDRSVATGVFTSLCACLFSVTFDKAPELADLENLTYMDAINYFCDIQLEKDLEKIRTGGRVTDTSGQDKNTVLVLPKIPGYMHNGLLIRKYVILLGLVSVLMEC